jgi:ABC-2 type transport system ATP-binding protein
MPVTGGAAVLTEAVRRMDAADIVLDDVALRRPTLDDVFLSLTGHATEQTGGSPTDTHDQEVAR